MTPRPLDVVGLGFSSIDLVGLAPGLPELDHDVALIDITRQGGGPVAQAMVTLSRLGASVGFVGRLADDEAGVAMRDQLVAEGVDLAELQIEPGARSAQCLILVHEPTGKRSMCCFPGTTQPVRPDLVDVDYVTSGRLLHLDGIATEAALWAASAARARGIPVCLDAGGAGDGLLPLLGMVDVLIAAEAFALAYAPGETIEHAAAKLLGSGPSLVVVTCGDRGSYTRHADDAFWTPAFAVDVVDTTGAGDVFHGGYLFGLLQGWDARVTAEFAGATAALKCTALGGRAGIPNLRTVLSFLETRGGPAPAVRQEVASR